jgi:hypothetical protein
VILLLPFTRINERTVVKDGVKLWGTPVYIVRVRAYIKLIVIINPPFIKTVEPLYRMMIKTGNRLPV